MKNSQKELKNKKNNRKTCFVIMPITTPDSHVEKYAGGKDHFRRVLDHLFLPAIEKAKLYPIPPIAKGAEVIPGEIIKNLESTDLVLCDMSILNANVFYELGIRTALNKPVSLVIDDITGKPPFDTSIINNHIYQSKLEIWNIEKDIDKLSDHIIKSIETSKGENTMWKRFGLTSIAHLAEAKGGDKSKLDYLMMQIEALTKDLKKSPTTQEIPYTSVSQDDMFMQEFLEQYLFSNKNIKLLRYKFNIPSRSVLLTVRKGTMPDSQKQAIVNWMDKYKIRLYLTEE